MDESPDRSEAKYISDEQTLFRPTISAEVKNGRNAIRVTIISYEMTQYITDSRLNRGHPKYTVSTNFHQLSEFDYMIHLIRF